MKKAIQIASYILIAACFIGCHSLDARAAVGTQVLPSCGVDLTITKGVALNQLTDRGLVVIQQVETPKAASIEELTEEDIFRNLVIAQVRGYVNIRNLPGEEGEIVGKLYNNSAGEFLGEENGWYRIQSGSVTGYVKGEYCVTGEEAIALAKEVGTRFAKVDVNVLKVRKEPSLEADVLGYMPMGEDVVVVAETDEWVQVDMEEGLGWMYAECVELYSEFVQAESKEEEEIRLAKEAEERKKARAAAEAKRRKEEEKRKKEQQELQQQATEKLTTSSTENSEMGVEVAQYALQFVGNPYVWGGTSLTNGADCSGFVMSVYANFGVSLPHSSKADRKQGYAVDGLENAQPGDLICYSGHVALYIGDGQIVHASSKKTGIKVSKADYKKILAIRRIF